MATLAPRHSPSLRQPGECLESQLRGKGGVIARTEGVDFARAGNFIHVRMNHKIRGHKTGQPRCNPPHWLRTLCSRDHCSSPTGVTMTCTSFRTIDANSGEDRFRRGAGLIAPHMRERALTYDKPIHNIVQLPQAHEQEIRLVKERERINYTAWLNTVPAASARIVQDC